MEWVVLVADTHGYFDEALFSSMAAWLKGKEVRLCVHAGDVAGRGPLDAATLLGRLAVCFPGTHAAVRGNTDNDETLPARAEVNVGNVRFIVVHGDGLASRPLPGARPPGLGEAGDVVVTGHSHIPAAFVEEGVVFVNPGSAGPARFGVPGRRSAVAGVLGGKLAELWVFEVGRKPRKWALDGNPTMIRGKKRRRHQRA